MLFLRQFLKSNKQKSKIIQRRIGLKATSATNQPSSAHTSTTALNGTGPKGSSRTDGATALPSPHSSPNGDLAKKTSPVVSTVKTPKQKTVWRKALDFAKQVYGIHEDNSAYLDFERTFEEKVRLELPNEDGNEIRARARVVKEFVDVAIKQVQEHGIKSLKPTMGAVMSQELCFLSGGYSPQQHYEHNLALKWWAESILDGRTVLDVEDLDNTNLNKNTTTWATRRVQSTSTIHWNSEAYEALNEDLRGKLLINTARSILPTAIYARNEGLEGSATTGILNSPLEELAGLSIDKQLELASCADIAAMNGSVVHYAGRPTKFSNKLLRADKILAFLNNPDNNVRIDDKSFIEAYFTGPTEEYEFTAAEPKGVTSYLLDTHEILGEVYYPHYLEIVRLKELHVDNRNRDDIPDDAIAWKNFAIAVEKNVQGGVKVYRNLDAYKTAILEEAGGNEVILEALDDRLSSARDEAYKHIRLIGADSLRTAEEKRKAEEKGIRYFDYYNLLKTNPKEFFHKVTEGRLTALNYHYFNSRGIPLTREVMAGLDAGKRVTVVGPDATERALFTLNRFANESVVRDKVRRLNSLPTTNGLHSDIENFRAEGIKILRGENLDPSLSSEDHDPTKSGPMAYVNWRLTRHLMHIYTKTQLQSIEDCREQNEGKRLFVCDRELTFSNDFLKLGRIVYENEGLEGYINWLRKQFSHQGEVQFSNSVGPEAELDDFMDATFPLDYFIGYQPEKEEVEGKDYFTFSDLETTPKEKRKTYRIVQDHFLPNELFSMNNKCAYNGSYSFFSIFTLVDKRDIKYVSKEDLEDPKNANKEYIFIPYRPVKALDSNNKAEKPLGFYAELGANPDAQYYPELQPAKEKFSAVPCFKDCREQNLAVLSAGDSKSDVGTHVAALERDGLASVVFGLIRDEDLHEGALDQRQRYVLDHGSSLDLKEVYDLSHGRVYGLLDEPIRDPITHALKSAGLYRKIKGFHESRQFRMPGYYDPDYVDDKIYTKEEIVAEIRDFYQGRIVHNICPEASIRRKAEILHLLTGRNIELSKEKYNQAVASYEGESLISQEAPRFRVYFEYRDENGNVFYRRKSDGALFALGKDGKEEIYTGDERKLKKSAIKSDFNGHFIKAGTGEFIANSEFLLNKCLCEEEFLPSASPIQGLLGDNLLTKLFGKNVVKKFVTNLPTIFNKILEWSGGGMALGGLVRLLFGFNDSMHKVGYWISNSLRAASALAGAMRGELNVYRSHNIFAGEMINIFAALKLPDGLKHAVLGFGNFVLFLGRGQQRAQQMQRINNHPEEVLRGEENKDKYVDPRTYVRDVTKFSTQLILDAKQTAKDFGLPPILGEVVGNLASATLTPIQMLKDIVREPKLIYQIVPRIAEKSGLSHRAVPSVGHLMTLVGALSGLSALAAATIGRVKDSGEEIFNGLGKFAISFANSIPAIGIIANGFEVMSNSAGLPRLSRDLNGHDIKYDPKRAGLGQVIAGIGYALVPWFGLHKKYVASVYDMVNGLYFGLPGARMSVAEEEKLNTINLARNILIEGQEYSKQRDSAAA